MKKILSRGIAMFAAFFAVALASSEARAEGWSWSRDLPAAVRFVVLSELRNQAVLDRETGLVWEKMPYSKANRIANADASVARANCIGSQTGGKSGWRFPSVEEIQSLRSANSDLPGGAPFEKVGKDSYWTSTTYVAGKNELYVASFGRPGFELENLDVTDAAQAWCVRGGSGYNPSVN